MHNTQRSRCSSFLQRVWESCIWRTPCVNFGRWPGYTRRLQSKINLCIRAKQLKADYLHSWLLTGQHINTVHSRECICSIHLCLINDCALCRISFVEKFILQQSRVISNWMAWHCVHDGYLHLDSTSLCYLKGQSWQEKVQVYYTINILERFTSPLWANPLIYQIHFS